MTLFSYLDFYCFPYFPKCFFSCIYINYINWGFFPYVIRSLSFFSIHYFDSVWLIFSSNYSFIWIRGWKKNALYSFKELETCTHTTIKNRKKETFLLQTALYRAIMPKPVDDRNILPITKRYEWCIGSWIWFLFYKAIHSY